MSAPPITERQARETVAIFEECGGNYTYAAERLGISRPSLYNRLSRARALYGLGMREATEEDDSAPFVAQELPSSDMPLDELLARRRAESERTIRAAEARELINVQIRTPGPIGLLIVGDPHIDDPGCDFNALERHLQVAKDRPDYLFACGIGDLQNAWPGRLTRLYAKQSTTVSDAWRLVEWMMTMVPWLFLVRGNHDCLDMETEALTKRGWTRFENIEATDEVFSMDRDTGGGVWTPILQKFDRENSDEMVHLTGTRMDMMVTKNHRVLHEKWNPWSKVWEPITYRPASDLPATFRVPVSAKVPAEEAPINDDWLILAGWLLTDGSILRPPRGRPHVHFYQSKECPSLEGALSRLGLEHSVVSRSRNIEEVCGRQLVKPPLQQREYRLTSDATARVLEVIAAKGELPAWAHTLSERQFDVLLNAIVEGDGCWDGIDPNARQCAVVHGTRAFLGSLQAVAVTHGWRANLSQARGKDWRLNLAKRPYWTALRAKSVATAPAVDRVWCLTVPYGNFMVRRNGKAYFTGNCFVGDNDPLKWIMRGNPGPVENHGVRLALHHPCGAETRINARHDFKGASMYNDLHGLVRELREGFRDHILVAGHRHIGAESAVVNPEGHISQLVRVSGYKVVDDYAKEGGYKAKPIHRSALIIVDPAKADSDRERVWLAPSVEMGAEYLDWLRARYDGRKPRVTVRAA